MIKWGTPKHPYATRVESPIVLLDTNVLVKSDGTCTMWETFKHDLEIDPSQLDLFANG